MRKLFSVYALVIMAAAVFATDANAKFRSGAGCYVDTSGNDSFWFCGTQKSKCDGRSVWKKNNVSVHGNGKGFTHGKDTYWCCLDAGAETGHYVQWGYSTFTHEKIGADGVTPETRVNNNLPNGDSCTYTVKVDACGNDVSEECHTASACGTGRIMRNGTCVEVCREGYAFDGERSNTCVSCDAGLHTGMIEHYVDTATGARKTIRVGDTIPAGVESWGKICLKCDQTTEIFDREEGKCKAKSELESYQKQALHACYACSSNDTYVQCVKEYRKNNGKVTTDALKKDCMIKN